ncbi:MAG: hypothetical protein LBS66_02165 [Rhodospirillaceae bacterium]|nr:hypothetical protein [Rhodospirillaceae bacterium]
MCPLVSALSDSVTLTKFRPGPGRDLTDVKFKAEITDYHGSCEYNAETKQVQLALKVGITADRHVGLDGRYADVNYYIAIPAFYPKLQAKQIIPVKLEFPEKTNRLHYVDDEINISIPQVDLKDMPAYEVFVGLQLTPDELSFNRQHKR